jgi:acyl-CoA reductase-like NAD-dependent aldehyde dehydrogenase
MKFDITTEPLNEEETEVILGAYDSARAAYDAVQTDNWENARAEFRDLCNAVAEWAAPEVHRRYELMRGANDVLMARQRVLSAALANLLADPLGKGARASAQALISWVNGEKA